MTTHTAGGFPGADYTDDGSAFCALIYADATTSPAKVLWRCDHSHELPDAIDCARAELERRGR